MDESIPGAGWTERKGPVCRPPGQPVLGKSSAWKTAEPGFSWSTVSMPLRW